MLSKMNVFGLGTSSLFAAGLSTLVALTFVAGLIKVALNKRDLKKKVKLANLEAANKQTDLEKLVGDREPDEGDLFGVRAIQAGFFGGVSQSCPNSPSSSRSSSLCSLGINPGESSYQKSSSTHLELPKLSHNASHNNRSRKTSSQNSTSTVDSNNSQVLPNDNITFGLQYNSNNSLPINQRSYNLTLGAEKDQAKSISDTSITLEPAPKSMRVSSASSEEESLSSQESYSKTNITNNHTLPSKYHRSQNSHGSIFEINKISNQENAFADTDELFANLPCPISPPAIIRDSVVSKQKVSIHQPIKSRRPIPNDKRLQGDVIPSICSMRTSITEPITDQSSTVESSNASNNLGTTKTSSTTENTRPRSSSSSRSSTSVYERPYRLASADLTPFALQDFELMQEDRASILGSDPRASRCSIGELYDTYYSQPNLYQNPMPNIKQIDFKMRTTSRTLA